MAIKKEKFPWLLLGTWGLFFIVLFARMISIRPDGIFVGHENVWSDWALHLGLATLFSEKSPALWFAYHPMYADGRMTYTFLTNLISGLLMRVGFSISFSFIMPSIVLSLLLIYGIHKLFTLLSGSTQKAYLGISIFFLAAGFGFIDFFKDWFEKPSLSAFILPPKQYSRIDDHQWYAGNFIVGHFLPQRSILIGMAFAVWALYGFMSVLLSGREDAKSKRTLVLSGLLAGVLPIAHMHSLIAMLIIMTPVAIVNYRKWKLMLYAIIPTAVVSAAFYWIFIAGGIENKHFMSWSLGYTAQDFWDWITFWVRAWGIMIPVAVAGLYLFIRRVPASTWGFFIGSFIIFILGNIIYFQPIAWDNSKLFAWSYLCFSLLAAEVVVFLWSRTRLLRSLSCLIFVLLTLTGLFEVILLQRIDTHTFQMIGREEMNLADQIRVGTGPLDRFLTSKDHNHFVMVRGARPIILGFTPWVLNFGFDYAQTEIDVDAIYRGMGNTISLLKKHRINYIVIGPAEINNFHPNLDYFKVHFPLAFHSQRYWIFKVE